MGSPKKWRFWFGLRGLLVAVAACAVGSFIYSWLPNPVNDNELARLTPGMTQEQVRRALREPDRILGEEDPPNAMWIYGFTGAVYFTDGLLDSTERM